MVKVWPLEDWGPLRGASVMNFNVKAKRLRSSRERSPGQRHLKKTSFVCTTQCTTNGGVGVRCLHKKHSFLLTHNKMADLLILNNLLM